MTILNQRISRANPTAAWAHDRLQGFTQSLLVGVLMLSGAARVAFASEEILPVGSQKVLLLDKAIVAESTGVELKLHPPRKTGERLLVSDRPWENATLNWFSIARDGDKFRMWYECYDVVGWPTADDTSFCYAESSDGIHWTKPKLGLVEYQGSKENNILFRQIGQGTARSRVHGSGVFLDPSAPPDARYKAVSQGLFQGIGDRPYWIAGMTSADGLAWKRIDLPICRVFADSQYSAFWDARLQKYVVYGRVGGHGRAIGRSQSDRFDQFPPLALVLQNEDSDAAQADLYNPACMRLPGSENIYLMCPSRFDHQADTLDIHLAVSRDGLHWTWPDRSTALVALGKSGQFDGGSLYMANGCAQVGEEIWFYFSGSRLKHEQVNLDTLADPANRRVYSRAVAPRDRLVSATASASGGTLVTRLLQYTGKQLQVNLVTRPGGQLRVGLLDRNGLPIAGRRVEECRPLAGAEQPQTVEWGMEKDVSAWASQPVRLELELKNADVFGFQFLSR